MSAPPPLWAVATLHRLFDKKRVDELPASKALKKVVKAAAQHSNQPAKELRSQLEAFLRRGEGGFKLQGDKVSRAPLPAQQEKKKKTKKKAKEAAAIAAEQEAQLPAAAAKAATTAAAVAATQPAKKKKKRKREAGNEGAGTSEVSMAAGEPEAKKRKKTKRKVGDGPEQGQAVMLPQQQHVQQQRQEQQQEAEEGQQPQQQQQQQQQQPQRREKQKPRRAAKGSRGVTAPAAAVATAAGASEDAQAAADAGDAGAGDEEGDPTSMVWRQNNRRKKVKSGAFSKAEKETIKEAVLAYAAANGCSTEDYSWLYGSSRSGETKGMWSKIAASLPHRTVKSVWAAGTRIYHPGNYKGSWSSEEDAQLLQLVSEKGRKWKEIGEMLGRMRETCRDRWLSIRLGEDKNSGRWGDDETERLRQAVSDYLGAKVAAEGQGAEGEGEMTLSMADITGAVGEPVVDEDGAAAFTVSRRVVLDDIDWSIVSNSVGTRTNIQCLEKWYTQLSPSMVARGEWGSGDDRRLLRSMFLSGASQEYDLDWNNLVRGRTAAQARRRWRLMLKVLPDHRDREFDELVEALVDKYLPQLKERRRQSDVGEGG